MVDLAKPEAGHAFLDGDRFTFEWSADRVLSEGQTYEVVFWRVGESIQEGRSPDGNRVTSNSATIKIELPPGDYYWGIWLWTDNSRTRPFGAVHPFRVTAPPEREPRGAPPKESLPPGDGGKP